MWRNINICNETMRKLHFFFNFYTASHPLTLAEIQDCIACSPTAECWVQMNASSCLSFLRIYIDLNSLSLNLSSAYTAAAEVHF